mmetsp:Transcript_22803/g.59584  ORF Transcript_22803/g.59584 Transcript_22803/m.59584 type:complete len:123 (-) Transcript_22803:204-572(-)
MLGHNNVSTCWDTTTPAHAGTQKCLHMLGRNSASTCCDSPMPAHNNASHGLSYCSEPPRHPRTERHARQKLHAHAHQAPSCMCTKQLGHLSGLESPFVAWITKKRPQARATDRRTDRGVTDT